MSRRSRTLARMRWLPGTHTRQGVRTNIRTRWQDAARRYTRLDATAEGHAAARNAYIKYRLRHVQSAHERHMRVLWNLGDATAFEAAYRQAAHTLCVVAGLHLAIQRRARRAARPTEALP